MKKKILLISPNPHGLEDKLAYPPLGLLYVAANLPSNWEPEVKIMTDDNFAEFGYENYGISVHSVAVVGKVKTLIFQIRAKNRNAIIFLGGAAAGAFKQTGRTLVFSGEFEKHIKDTDNLDNIKFPARHLVPYEHIHYTGGVHHTKEPSTTMIATRGCTYSCNFCDRETFGRKFRKRSAENICKEVEELIKKYKIKQIRFCDDCITLDKWWFIDLCMELSKYKIKWTCMSRADLLDPRTLRVMKNSGCREIFFGFESGSQKMLNLMNKGSTVNKYSSIIQKCKEAGIKSCAYMLFGFPGEDERTIDETINFLEKTKPDKSRLSEFVPFPGCDVGNHPAKYNVALRNGKDYWYYDNQDLALKYNYIDDDQMLALREKIRSYYKKNFKQNWTN